MSTIDAGTTDTTTTVHGTGLGTKSTEHPSFRGVIDLPYTLSAGKAAGTFLAELANQTILASRAPGGPVMVPAQDFCAHTGEAAGELLVVGNSGSIRGFTENAAGVIALIRLDGAETDFPHRVLGTSAADLRIGQRVTAQWAAEAEGQMLDLEGFTTSDAPEDAAGPTPYTGDAEPIAELKYGMKLEYDHAYGPYYGRMFDELATSRRIVGVKCPSCTAVLVPPRAYCDVCFVPTAEWVDVADTGILKAFSVIHLEFVGQTRKPPYIYAEIVLDGCNTRLIHAVGDIDAEKAPELLRCGMRVQAVWKEGVEPTGTLEDIEHFKAIDD